RHLLPCDQRSPPPGSDAHVGGPVTAVVVEAAAQLQDAIDAVHVQYEPVPAVVSTWEALKTTARLYDTWPDNVASVSTDGVGDVEEAMAAADLVVAHELRHARNAAMPMEPRGVLAWHDDAGVLVVHSSTQTTYFVREAIAAVLGLDVERIRVMAPTVGGPFGPKAEVFRGAVLVT